MASYEIRGGKPLRGVVSLSGSKNAALPIIASSVLTRDEVIIHNVPMHLNDTKVLIEIINAMGCQCHIDGNSLIKTGTLTAREVPDELGKKIRSTLIFLGLLLNRFGEGRIPNPGGCQIGDRKYDIHLNSLRELSASIESTHEHIYVRTDGLVGKELLFYLPTTTGTQNVILGALAATGRTIIKNANTRPENVNFAEFLNTMGARVNMKNRIAEIHPCKRLHGCEYSVMGGRDELVTYIALAAMTGGEIQIRNASLSQVPTEKTVFKNSGVDIFEWGDSVFVSAKDRSLHSIDIATAPYPGINSDLQPVFAAYSSVANGESTVTDMRFTDRFQYVSELKKFGMEIEAYGNCAVINGGRQLRPATVTATDLRGGAAMVLAALTVNGKSRVENIYQIERGYEDFLTKLRSLGADVRKVD